MSKQNGGIDGVVSAHNVDGSATSIINISGNMVPNGSVGGATETFDVNGAAVASRKIIGMVASRGGGIKEIYSDTTANWNAKFGLIGKKDCLYIYTDYIIEGGIPIPSIKVGDGKAYLIDLPFIYSGNVTAEQIAFWNNKVTVYEEYVSEETLMISKN